MSSTTSDSPLFLESLGELETALADVVRQQQHAAEETSNRETLRAIQRAFREALLVLPEEEYDWFEAYGVDGHRRKRPGGSRRGCTADDRTGRRAARCRPDARR